MNRLSIALPHEKYDIVINNNFSTISNEIEALWTGGKIIIITDDIVGKAYLSSLTNELKKIFPIIYSYALPNGEDSKCIETLNQIYDFFLSKHVDRSDLIIALGGGVVGDIAGYSAATYLRGIAYMQIPTTLLAQVDSSVGGKVAVNYRGIKNLVGAFYQPILVYINVKTLKTLPEREFRNGLAEVIVHGVIQDASLIEFTVNHFCDYHNINDDQLEELIYKNCKIKANIVMQDEKDKGIRKILNFGHTVGHAIESLFEYKYTHGECISIGMVAAFKISVFYKLINEKELRHIKDILNTLGLPTEIENLDYDETVKKIIFDKKMFSGNPVFILPVEIGKVIDYKVQINEISKIFEEEE